MPQALGLLVASLSLSLSLSLGIVALSVTQSASSRFPRFAFAVFSENSSIKYRLWQQKQHYPAAVVLRHTLLQGPTRPRASNSC